MNGFLILTEEERPLEAVMSFSFAIHKGPVAFYTCHKTLSDYQLVVTFYNTFFLTSADTWGPEIVKIVWNVFFNLVDLMYELEFLELANEEREWTTIGEYLAKISSDIFFKSPITTSWNYKNSDALNEEWVEPLSIKDGGIKTINFVLEKLGMDPIMQNKDANDQAEEDSNALDGEGSDPFVMSVRSTEVNDSNRVQAINALTKCVKKYPDIPSKSQLQ